MNKRAYLATPHVGEFADHLVQQLAADGRFAHSYQHRKSQKNWACGSLFEAFEHYEWNKKDYQETLRELQPLTQALRQSVANNDEGTCQAACRQILTWGGVGEQKPTNLIALGTLSRLHGSLPAYFEKVRAQVDDAEFSTDSVWEGIKMNAGFTKLYALLFDNFIIYDSRVGAALGLLVRQWCEQKAVPEVPKELRFSFGYAQGKEAVRHSRNPSCGLLTFTALTPGKRHTIHNVWANWLLTHVLEQTTETSPFRQLPAAERLRAVEAALFMVGYDVRAAGAA